MWPGPSGFGSGKGNRSGSGSGSLYSHSYWLTIFVQPIGEQCCRRRGRKIQIILGGKTQCLMNLLQMGQQLLRTITKTLTRIELIKTTLILGTHLNKYIYIYIPMKMTLFLIFFIWYAESLGFFSQILTITVNVVFLQPTRCIVIVNLSPIIKLAKISLSTKDKPYNKKQMCSDRNFGSVYC